MGVQFLGVQFLTKFFDYMVPGMIFSERELMFMFDVVVRPSVVCLTFVHPTQPIEIFGNVSAPFNTLVT